jgi:hypothetical protein
MAANSGVVLRTGPVMYELYRSFGDASAGSSAGFTEGDATEGAHTQAESQATVGVHVGADAREKVVESLRAWQHE